MYREEVDSIKTKCDIVNRKVPCGTCIDKNRKPTGRTLYELESGHHAHDCAIREDEDAACTCHGIGERTCLSCDGSKWEKIDVNTMLKAATELSKYRYPQLKAIEVTGEGGGPIQHSHEIKLVD
jgi:hypothetical protein